MKIQYILPLMAIVLSSCGETQEKEVISGPQTVFEHFSKSHYYTILGMKSDIGPDNDFTVCDSVSLILPLQTNGIDSGALCDTIIARALGVTDMTISDAILDWFSQARTLHETETSELSAIPEYIDGYNIIEGKVVNFTPQLLSYCIENTMLLPGTVGVLKQNDYVNYSVTQNRLITLDDIFTAEGLNELPGLIAAKAEDNPWYAGQEEITELPYNNNFFLSSEGEIVFNYQPLEAGPQSLGNVQISFRPEELVTLMTPGAVADFGLKDLVE